MHANNVGTTAFVTDYSGAVVQDELHYPWGREWAVQGTLTEERYASLHHRDPETGLDPTHFRMYSSGTYRWFTPDPLQADIFNPQSISRYSYAGGNSVSFTDPSGLASDCTPATMPDGTVGLSCAIGDSVTVTGAPPSWLLDPSGLPPQNPYGTKCLPSIGAFCEYSTYYTGAYVAPAPPKPGPTRPPTIGPPQPPTIGAPPPPPTPVHTGSYTDYLKCVGAALSFLPGSETGRATAVVNAAGAGAVLEGGSVLYPAVGYVFDLALAVRIREACIEQVYGPGYF
jgi:RHS repeat-associated protein